MKKTKSPFWWLLKKIKKRIPVLLFLTLCSIGVSLCGVFFALGTRGVIDTAIAGERGAFIRACIKQAIIILCILSLSTVKRILNDRIHAVLDIDWKKTLLHDLMKSEYSSVSAYHSSELINRLNNDVRILDDGIINLIPNLSSMITKLIAAFCVLASMAPMFTFALLAVGVIVVAVTGVLRKNLKGLHKRVSEANGRVSAIMQETMEKLLAVQAMDIMQEIELRAKRRMDERYVIQRKRRKISVLSNTCISVMFYTASFATLVFCASNLLVGSMSYGSMTAIIQLVNQIQSPLVGLSGFMPQFIAASAAVDRLYELEQLPKTVPPLEEPAVDIYERMDGILAEDLVFTYDRDCIFDNAGFYLPKGAFCIVTGPSGVGKSTLLKLLLGIYKADNGGLYVRCENDRIPIDGSTRKLFSYVPQGNLLFSGTIRDNLVVVKPDATKEEIDRAVYVSAMDSFLSQLPNGLDTMLGESGAGLSEGQGQRLAIARAVLGDAPILLLDECTSALDAKTEVLVLERLRALNNKTCIAVTHRMVAGQICNMSIEMHNGKICINRLD